MDGMTAGPRLAVEMMAIVAVPAMVSILIPEEPVPAPITVIKGAVKSVIKAVVIIAGGADTHTDTDRVAVCATRSNSVASGNNIFRMTRPFLDNVPYESKRIGSARDAQMHTTNSRGQ